MEWHRDGYCVSTDPARLDREAIWAFLQTSYWAAGVPREAIERSFENSLVFGLYDPRGEQAGFARAVTDRARFAWLGDVFVLEPHRGTGLGVWLVECILSHPDLAGTRIVLGTADAHGLYERFGFRNVDAARMMERGGRHHRPAAADRSTSAGA
jgi:GNAT superfamily N-acetyltransferase